MLFCDGCDKGFHMNCHNPQVMEKPSGRNTEILHELFGKTLLELICFLPFYVFQDPVLVKRCFADRLKIYIFATVVS